MKKNKCLNLIYISLILGFLILSCSKNNTISDVDQTAALRNVTITYDSVFFQLQLPAGALSGQSFAQLKKQDSATYTNPANYSIIILGNYTANNKKSNAQDAKFDGMTVNIVMDTINSSPIKAFSDSFVVKKNTSIPVLLNTTINLAKQRRAGIYILQQFVNGNDLVTTQTPYLNYKIGLLQGTIELPTFKENIPTRASNITKSFLSGLLDSGTFN
jgi:hypothetical protein